MCVNFKWKQISYRVETLKKKKKKEERKSYVFFQEFGGGKVKSISEKWCDQNKSRSPINSSASERESGTRLFFSP